MSESRRRARLADGGAAESEGMDTRRRMVDGHAPAAQKLKLGRRLPELFLSSPVAVSSSTLRSLEPSVFGKSSSVMVYCSGRDTESTRLFLASAKPVVPE